MNKPTTRRVTVMMMNSHMHVELVEIKIQVVMTGTVENVEFKCITKDAETAARDLIRKVANGIDGPANPRQDADDYHMVGVLVSCLYGPLAGRIVWAKEADVTTKTKIIA